MTAGEQAVPVVRRAGLARRTRSGAGWTWLGLMPFALYCLAFLMLPAATVLVHALQDRSGAWTLHNMTRLGRGEYLTAFRSSIQVSLTSAVIGGAIGALMAYGALADGTPRWVRGVLSTFSGVAANFAGVPLAFAFIATLGTTGILTRFLADHLGVNLYRDGFTLFGFWGVVLTYVYFQIPLMILVIAPAIDGLKPQWREAAQVLGGGSPTYWWRVGLPILTPSLLGAMVLLFGNAFSAYATAAALTSGGVPLVPLEIGNLVSGNVLSDPNQAHALALGMIVVVTLTMVVYAILARRAGRWLS